jgi:hypothetical protein
MVVLPWLILLRRLFRSAALDVFALRQVCQPAILRLFIDGDSRNTLRGMLRLHVVAAAPQPGADSAIGSRLAHQRRSRAGFTPPHGLLVSVPAYSRFPETKALFPHPVGPARAMRWP